MGEIKLVVIYLLDQRFGPLLPITTPDLACSSLNCGTSLTYARLCYMRPWQS